MSTVRRAGFSFTEILFAVMVLGIGFIMIAAIFPVAIKQTQATGEETNASTIAKGGVDYFEKIATDTIMPPTTAATGPGTVVYQDGATGGGNTTFWSALRGNLILPSDPRYAWIPMYKRDVSATLGAATAASPYAQVIIIGVQVRNRTTYDAASDLTVPLVAPPLPASLQARPVMATFTSHMPASADTITFALDGTTDFTGAVAEGTFVVVANDISTPQKQQYAGNANGWIYRVGNPVSNAANTWELAPGNDMYGANYKPTSAHVLIVGRGYTDPGGNPADFTPSGPAQDIAVYTTFVTIKTSN